VVGACDFVESEHLKREVLVVGVVFFEAALQAIEHGDGVNNNESDFVF